MADSEFEEFRQYFDQLPQHIKAPARCYTLAHDITPLEEFPPPPSFEDLQNLQSQEQQPRSHTPKLEHRFSSKSSSSEDDLPDIPYMRVDSRYRHSSGSPPPMPHLFSHREVSFSPVVALQQNESASPHSSPLKQLRSRHEEATTVTDLLLPGSPLPQRKEERRRRKLPEIPTIQRVVHAPSLAEELFELDSNRASAWGSNIANTQNYRPGFRHNVMRIPDDESSCESDAWPGTDGDSGNSTFHSPEGPKSTSPMVNMEGSVSPGSTTPSLMSQYYPGADLLEATHRGLHKFLPRHHDEVEVEIGDPIHVQREAEDYWCEGVNLRTRRKGIFPSAYVVDLEYADFDPNAAQLKKERYILNYLGSMEASQHKGEHVLIAAVKRIQMLDPPPHPQPCILEISDQGLRMTDRSKPGPNQVYCHDYFYALKNVSFCGFHPKEQRYFGFVTKHPQQLKFACHVFRAETTTRPVAEAVGRAFQRFYQKFIELAYPIHEFYME